MAVDAQQKRDLKRRIAANILAALPQLSSQNRAACIQVWQRRIEKFVQMHQEVAALSRRLIERNNGSADSSINADFSAPDVLRAELLQDSSAMGLIQAVDKATSVECSSLAALITDRICDRLVAEGTIGWMERFPNDVARLTIPDGNGSAAVVDLVEIQSNKIADSSRKLPVPRRLLRAIPAWLDQSVNVHSAQCVRWVDGQGRNLMPANDAVSLLTLGPFVLSASIPWAPTMLPELNRIKIAGSICTAVWLVSVAAGIVLKLPLLTACGGLALVASTILFLRS